MLGTPDVASPALEPAIIQPNFTGCTKNLVSSVNSAYEQEIVYLTNLERQKIGAAPLKRSLDFDYAARYHAKDLIDDNYFDHPTYDGWGNGVDGKTYVCSTSARIALYSNGYRGENIAGGYGTPVEAMAGWMGSSGHRTNLLNTGHREIGVGYYSGGYWRSYWVQDFGTRSAVYPLVINLESAQTNSAQVSLYIYGAGTFSQMRLKNDADAWSAWMPFSSTLSWSLKPLQGIRTVTVELKKDDGSTSSSSDDIYLTNGAQLTGLPSSINFYFNQVTGELLPAGVMLQPQNGGGTLTLNWTASPGAEGWVSLSQPGGASPGGSTQVGIEDVENFTVGQYSSSVTVAVTEPSGVLNSPQVVPVRLVVVDLPYMLFLPQLLR